MFNHSITEFVFLTKEYVRGAQRSAIVTQERWQEGEKQAWFLNHLRMSRILTKLDGIASELAIISRQLFAGHMAMVGSLPMRRKKNLQRILFKMAFQNRDEIDHDYL